MVEQTSTVTRAFTFPQPDDTIDTLAARVLAGADDARATLLAWNPHLALRPAIDRPGSLLCTDLVYTEPPR